MVRTSELPITHVLAASYWEDSKEYEYRGWPGRMEQDCMIDAIKGADVEATLVPVHVWGKHAHALILPDSVSSIWRTWLVALDTDTES